MPNYEFACDSCKEYIEFFVKAEEINEMKDGFNISCEKCGDKMYQIFTNISFRFRGGEPPTGVQSKQRRAAVKDEAIYNEGFTCENEVKEARDMAAEEEKKRGMVPGTLTDGVKAPNTKEDWAKVKKRCEKKKTDQQRARKKLKF